VFRYAAVLLLLFLGLDYAFDHEPMDRRFCRAAARTWLDRGSHWDTRGTLIKKRAAFRYWIRPFRVVGISILCQFCDKARP
jgi:hypothetical protein